MKTNRGLRPALGMLAIAVMLTGCSTMPGSANSGFKSRDLNANGNVSQSEFAADAQGRFKASDTNGDGQLTADELYADYLARWMAADTDHDGVVSLDEHLAYWVGPEQAKKISTGSTKADIGRANMHGQMDSNADGQVSFEEKRDYAIARFKAISKDGKGITKEDVSIMVHTMFTAMDTNKDGIVSIEEYTTYQVGGDPVLQTQ